MGTNYYLESRPERCAACGHIGEPTREHIGKSSAGWVFSLHVTEHLRSLDDWRKEIERGDRRIVDEYGSELTAEDMVGIIVDRGGKGSTWKTKPWGYNSWEAFHAANGSEFGPNGLLRGKLGGRCVGHGDGTWDLYEGEFS